MHLPLCEKPPGRRRPAPGSICGLHFNPLPDRPDEDRYSCLHVVALPTTTGCGAAHQTGKQLWRIHRWHQGPRMHRQSAARHAAFRGPAERHPHLCADFIAVVAGHEAPHQLVVQRDGRHHGLGVPLPQLGAALHIRAHQRQRLPLRCTPTCAASGAWHRAAFQGQLCWCASSVSPQCSTGRVSCWCTACRPSLGVPPGAWQAPRKPQLPADGPARLGTLKGDSLHSPDLQGADGGHARLSLLGWPAAAACRGSDVCKHHR